MKHAIIFLLPALPALGCSAVEPAATGSDLVATELGSIQRIHAAGEVFLAGQPAAADLEKAREAGIRTVITLRREGELDWDEGRVVRDLGMEFRAIGFREPESLTDQIFDNVRDLLRDPVRRPVLIHCGSANRVGAVWIPYRVLDGGLDVDEAVAEARRVGLRTAEYESRAREYIDRRR